MGESLREAHRPTRSLAMPKSKMHVGCWNRRTIYTVWKAAQVAREMEQYRLDLMGLREIRWTGAGWIKMRNGYTRIYAGEALRRKWAPERGGNHDEPGHTEMSDWMDTSKQPHNNCTILLPLQKYNSHPSVCSDDWINRWWDGWFLWSTPVNFWKKISDEIRTKEKMELDWPRAQKGEEWWLHGGDGVAT